MLEQQASVASACSCLQELTLINVPEVVASKIFEVTLFTFLPTQKH